MSDLQNINAGQGHIHKYEKIKGNYTTAMPTFILIIFNQWRTQEFYSGGGSTNSVEDRENGDLRAVAP
jgi:hypothetical protein